MSRALLVLWIATLGADRIDLLAGAGPLLLRPLLLLIPPLMVIELVRLAQRGRSILLPPSAATFFAGQTALLAIFLLSVMYSREMGLGLQRFALVAVESYAALLAVIFLVNRPDARSILLRGAYVGLALILLFDLVQGSRWIGGPGFGWLSLGGMVDLTPTTYGPWLPRPSGVSLDPNRGGLLIIVYLSLVAILARPSRARIAAMACGVVLLLVTLSRSALMAGAVVLAAAIVRRGVGVSRTTVAVASTAVALVAGVLLVSPGAQQALLGLLDVLAGRLTVAEGSSSIHLALLERGWEISTDSVRNALLGIGFGNSFLVLQDFFSGTKYGNFHSAYVAILVEAGAGAVVVFLALLFRPIFRPSALTPLVCGLAVFNVFYQSHVDAILWFVLALAWIAHDLVVAGPPADESEIERSSNDGSETRIVAA